MQNIIIQLADMLNKSRICADSLNRIACCFCLLLLVERDMATNTTDCITLKKGPDPHKPEPSIFELHFVDPPPLPRCHEFRLHMPTTAGGLSSNYVTVTILHVIAAPCKTCKTAVNRSEVRGARAMVLVLALAQGCKIQIPCSAHLHHP